MTEAHTLSLPAAMLLVFGSAKLLAELFEYFHLPGIVGEIAAGIVLGPSVLNLVEPNELLHTLSELGVMFLLFRVGLEVKAGDLMKLGGVATTVAMVGVIVPLIMGWAIIAGFGYPQIEAMFVGAAMVATSVGITAQVLAGKGLLDHVTAKIILAAAVIDDVLGLLVLAVVSGAARGKVNYLDIALTCALSVLFVVLTAKWGSHAMGRVMPAVQKRLHAQEAEFSLALVLLFGLAVLATHTGIAAIVGAFLAGMALSESVGPRVHDLAMGTTELLVPFFLVGIGLNVDLRMFSDQRIVLLTSLILGAALISKFVGCGLGALSLGRLDAVRVGVGMVPRGEVGMVVAQLGLSMKVISRPLYAAVVGMAVGTTILAPWLLSLAYRDVRSKEETEVFRLG